MQENRIKRLKMAIAAQSVLCMIALAGIFCVRQNDGAGGAAESGTRWAEEAVSDGYIKWVDFTVTYEALCRAYEWDVDTAQDAVHIDWVEMLAYLGAKYGGDFAHNEKRLQKDMAKLAAALTEEGQTMQTLTADMKYYAYYEEAYRAVLGGMVGTYEIETTAEDGTVQWQQMYGLKAYSPIARGFEYSHYDDFGSSRSYGYKRPHLGHDMMGQVGTPIRTKN